MKQSSIKKEDIIFANYEFLTAKQLKNLRNHGKLSTEAQA